MKHEYSRNSLFRAGLEFSKLSERDLGDDASPDTTTLPVWRDP